MGDDGVVLPIDRFLLIVTDLIVAPKANSDKFLPYPLLQYNVQHDRIAKVNVPVMHIIDAESIFRPAILIPCPDRSKNFGKPFKIHNSKKK
jgi:hypothetical protein